MDKVAHLVMEFKKLADSLQEAFGLRTPRVAEKFSKGSPFARTGHLGAGGNMGPPWVRGEGRVGNEGRRGRATGAPGFAAASGQVINGIANSYPGIG